MSAIIETLQTTTAKSQLAWRYGLGFLGLRQSDIWFASFPKSGTSWFRLILWNIISLQERAGEEVDYRTIDEMPALGETNLLLPWRYQSLPRIIKTHRPYRSPLFDRPQKSILLIRDPRDIMVSYYQMAQATKASWGRFEGDFSTFLRHPRFGLEAWFRHYVSWQPIATTQVTYEALRGDTLTELQRVLNELNISVKQEVLTQAIERASFDRMQRVEKAVGIGNRRFDETFQFVRSGKSGGWGDHFQPADLSYYQTLHDQFDIGFYQPNSTSENQ